VSTRLIAALSAVLVALGASSWIWTLPPSAGASSHREAPLTSKDPTIDNVDVFAFVSPDDATKITLISTWIPFEEPAGGPNFYRFDDIARYLIKVDRDGDGVEDVTYEWTFRNEIRDPSTFLYNTGPITSLDDADYNFRQLYRIREIVRGGSTTTLGENLVMPPDNIGPRSTPNYGALAARAIRDLGAGITEFTGQRDDPFYIDIGAIFDLLGLRPFNSAHLVRRGTEAGVDSMGGFNIHATAIQVPRARLAPDCPDNAADKRCVIGVWSTSERRSTVVRGAGARTGSGDFVQVSRLGNPLVNELVVDLARKDAFNGTPPTGDAVVLDRVVDPELGRLIELLYPGIDVPPAPRNDLVAVFLTGVAGLNQQVNSTSSPSEQLRLNTAIRPTAGVCAGNTLGVIAGDKAGFPNGRRIEDDVTDIELRVVAGVLVPGFNKAPNNQLGDGVNTNDMACLGAFPYLANPHQGYEHDHHAVGSTTTPALPGSGGGGGGGGGGGDDDDDDDTPPPPVAQVNDPNNDDEEDEDRPRLTEEERDQKERTNRSNRSDHVTEGGVVEVRCEASAPVALTVVRPDDVPYAVIANIDGNQQIRLLRETRAQCGSIQVGDYLEIDGNKESEVLFDADSVTIRRGGRRVR